MKLQFDPSNKSRVGFIMIPLGLLILGVQIMERQAAQRTIGFIALGIVIISAIVLFKSNVYRLKVIALCVGGTGLAFLVGYMITTIVLE